MHWATMRLIYQFLNALKWDGPLLVFSHANVCKVNL